MTALLPPRGETFAFLGLGSNVGDRLGHLQGALDRLAALPGIAVEAVSSVYETEPVGGPEQGPYLNVAARITTSRSPRRLLDGCAAVEQALGRTREVRWGPRTIDVDILVYGRRLVRTRRLQIPHPRLAERAFALAPLLEIAPGLELPDGTSLALALARLAPITGVGVIGAQIQVPGATPPW